MALLSSLVRGTISEMSIGLRAILHDWTVESDRSGSFVNLAGKLRCLNLALDVSLFEAVGSNWSAELSRDADHRRELTLVPVCHHALVSLQWTERRYT
jgi:hypothetical protein